MNLSDTIFAKFLTLRDPFVTCNGVCTRSVRSVPIRCYKHPCLSAPVELFLSVGMNIFMEIPIGIKNLLFPVVSSGDGFGVKVFHSISNGDKVIG